MEYHDIVGDHRIKYHGSCPDRVGAQYQHITSTRQHIDTGPKHAWHGTMACYAWVALLHAGAYNT